MHLKKKDLNVALHQNGGNIVKYLIALRNLASYSINQNTRN